MLNVTSPYYVHDVAGKFVKIRGIITNLNPINTTSGGLAYISIVDIKEKIPVDLEDWSVEKGLYIPSIHAGQSLPLEWDVRLVKAGTYTVDILFNTNSSLHAPPVVSPKISLIVDPKSNLNPGNVLPVTFGVPAVLMATQDQFITCVPGKLIYSIFKMRVQCFMIHGITFFNYNLFYRLLPQY